MHVAARLKTSVATVRSVGSALGARASSLIADLRASAPASGVREALGRLRSRPPAAEASGLRLRLRWARARARVALRPRHVRAAVGFIGVSGAVALVLALVVAFGLNQRQGAVSPATDVARRSDSTLKPHVTKLDLTRSRDGIRITVIRAERLPRGGRVYLRAENRSRARIAIPDSDIRLTQRYGQAQPAVDPYAQGPPSFGPTLAPGDSATSVRYFPRLRRGGAHVEVQWFSGDTTLRSTPFTFSFEVT